MKKKMTAENVLDIYSSLKNQDIEIWLDGGWGVDALLKKQTRSHADVDIVVQEKDLKKLEGYFKKNNFSRINRNDSRAWNYVMNNGRHGQVDVHVINIAKNGDGIYGPEENGDVYPASSLLGIGEINRSLVRCLSAEYQVESHLGYELKEKDYKDVSALCGSFNLDLPEEYSHLAQD